MYELIDNGPMPLTTETLDVYVLVLSEAEGREAFENQKPLELEGPNGVKLSIVIASETRQRPGAPVSFSGTVVVRGKNPASSSTNFSLAPKMTFVPLGDGLRLLQGV
jgi:hypothetical protein